MVSTGASNSLGGGALALNFAQGAYQLLMRLLAPVAIGWFWWRSRKEPAYARRWGERLGYHNLPPEASSGILLHAASVGEVQAAQSLLKGLRHHWPTHALTVSTMTHTGAQALLNTWGDQIRHVFLPLDTPGATARFLDRLQPSLLVLVEREIWPELLRQCQKRCIPVALVNARLSDRSARTYRRLQPLFRPVWQQMALVAAAETQSLNRYLSLGIPPAHGLCTGNLKFDLPSDPKPLPPESVPGGRFMVVAGSTHDAEEDALLALWPDLAQRCPQVLLVLVPRHPQRFAAVADKLKAKGLTVARHSQAERPSPETAVWLGDTMGHLPHWYRLADLCFIGGSLQPVGGHNPLEAMTHGKPVFYGPYTYNFEQLYLEMDAAGAGQRVATAEAWVALIQQACKTMTPFLEMGVRGADWLRQQRGATDRTIQALIALWAPMQPHALGRIAVDYIGKSQVWSDPALLVPPLPGDFDPAALSRVVKPMATGSGRGQVHIVQHGQNPLVLRHYRRGGLVALISNDRFWGTQARNSRAMREFLLLRQMRAWNLSVPTPAAAHVEKHGPWQSADIMVALIPGSCNLVQRLQTAPLNATEWHRIGAAVRALHERQVFHSDLNAHNLLLDAEGKAWIVDFDKCSLRAGHAWRVSNLDRLLRSLRKERQRSPGFCWLEHDWSYLLQGYEDIW